MYFLTSHWTTFWDYQNVSSESVLGKIWATLMGISMEIGQLEITFQTANLDISNLRRLGAPIRDVYRPLLDTPTQT